MLKQILFEMKHQKMMTWVSISGTAFAIFLVMVFFMVDRLSVADGYPEYNRSRMLYGGGFEIDGEGWMRSGAMSREIAERIFGNLDGIEKMAISSWNSASNVSAPGKIGYPLSTTYTDDIFWDTYNFRFINGKPYDRASVESGEKIAVITRSTARKLFSKEDVKGEEIRIDSKPYFIVGVVDDVSPIMPATFANVYLPLDYSNKEQNERFGNTKVHLLMKEGITEEYIKKQVESRYERLNQELEKDSMKAVYHEAPHNVEYLAKTHIVSNVTPDLSAQHTQTYLTYFILLLLPVINLSNMMRGRLRHRTSEIGVRRAYGAKRSDIIWQLLGENFIITVIGGIIGFALSFIFISFAADYFFDIYGRNYDAVGQSNDLSSIRMMFTWTNFLIALVVCFILNLLSAFIPSWNASRIEPAIAIAKTKI